MRDLVETRPYLLLGSRLRRLADQMQAQALAITDLAGVHVPTGSFSIVAWLFENGPQTVGDLAQSIRISQPAITKAVGKLAAAGLVVTTREQADGRRRTVALTSSGRAIAERGSALVWPDIEAVVHEVIDDLTGPFVAQLGVIEERLASASLVKRALAGAAIVLRPARDVELAAIASLLNQAYRGTAQGSGWCSEADYMDGARTDEARLRAELVAAPAAELLIWDLWGRIAGCVMIEPLKAGRWQLGSLAVDPSLQEAGAGRRLLAAAEQLVCDRDGQSIRLTVVNVRDTLIAWYERRGYRRTGAVEPYPYDDLRYGTPRRSDLNFVVMEKRL